jgi:hypothetical protein
MFPEWLRLYRIIVEFSRVQMSLREPEDDVYDSAREI